MRVVTVFASAVLVLGLNVQARAYEHFIPLGAGYSTEVSSLPALNSTAEAVTVQTDIYETEIYNRQLEQHRRDSYLQHSFSDSISAGPDNALNY